MSKQPGRRMEYRNIWKLHEFRDRSSDVYILRRIRGCHNRWPFDSISIILLFFRLFILIYSYLFLSLYPLVHLYLYFYPRYSASYTRGPSHVPFSFHPSCISESRAYYSYQPVEIGPGPCQSKRGYLIDSPALLKGPEY
ncbi:hypothetical protein M430DRAFT_211748 [Amorphotheca resinae ATCC 22711]|uniref:Uncharacterized protein n=1 Tax=Amorphotheca resinae ATCC 22711 TaxID=857342 RepID=A0A2T3B815_AMORE|nr:hypothetical protein M430DRAFT_211748 [Amorphotheca resinae ATCC 22711]PSS22981.1 hypothetical protein M430DRAFT_211748 [Amorphotheca resinae ATCC 22711]